MWEGSSSVRYREEGRRGVYTHIIRKGVARHTIDAISFFFRKKTITIKSYFSDSSDRYNMYCIQILHFSDYIGYMRSIGYQITSSFIHGIIDSSIIYDGMDNFKIYAPSFRISIVQVNLCRYSIIRTIHITTCSALKNSMRWSL